MDTEGLNLAKVAYEAYCAVTGGRSAISGDTLPPFERCPELVQAAWVAAAQAVKNYDDSN